MKNIFKYTILGVSIIGMTTSCSDYLNTSSPSTATPDFVYSNPRTAKLALDNAYELWRASGSVHSNGVFYDVVIGGSDSERHPEAWDAQAARQIPENLYPGGTSSYNIDIDGNFKTAYNNLYSIISTCNTLIGQFEATDTYKEYMNSGSASVMSDLYGQAVALRSTCYMELCRFFGDVPYTTVTGQKANGLTPRDSIYECVLNDLQRVEPYMYYVTSTTKNTMSRNYVDGLIGRICLYAGGYATRRTDLGNDFYKDIEGKTITFNNISTSATTKSAYGRRSDWAKFYTIAAKYLQDCVDNHGAASLCTTDPRSGVCSGNPYQYVFQQTMMDDASSETYSSESIYEIVETQGVQTERPYAFGRPSSGGSSNGYPCKSYGQSRFNPIYYYGDFDPNDMRRDVTCTVTGSTGKSVEKLISFKPGSKSDGGGIVLNKWDDNRMDKPYVTKQRLSGINDPYMRFSEILLMLAEVYAEDGTTVQNTSLANTYLTQVHNRAFKTPTLSNVSQFITDCGGLKKAILQERKLEFGGEGMRRYDLIRTGMLQDANTDFHAKTSAMLNGLSTQGYYTFPNGNQISNYIWIKDVDAKSLKGYRLTGQCTDTTDPILFPGWRGQNNNWEAYGFTGTATNLAIKGLFNYIDPAGSEAKALEASGYKKTEWGKTLLTYQVDYNTYILSGCVANTPPIYLVPLSSETCSTAGVTNGYGFSSNAQ
ncbi:MAG TPA: RagB/SusD family nutrient uptake outer membrane protein [Xylanibacter oryzae]|nr:RagB/SusD family nutrient uptake outer membrane protein [Xylanibacter oryzae]